MTVNLAMQGYFKIWCPRRWRGRWGEQLRSVLRGKLISWWSWLGRQCHRNWLWWRWRRWWRWKRQRELTLKNDSQKNLIDSENRMNIVRLDNLEIMLFLMFLWLYWIVDHFWFLHCSPCGVGTAGESSMDMRGKINFLRKCCAALTGKRGT